MSDDGRIVSRAADGRAVVELALGDGVKATVVEFEVMTATDLLPELLAAVGPGYAAGAGGGTLGDAVEKVAAALGGGKLSALLPRMLSGTTMVFPDPQGKLMSKALGSREALNLAFTGRKKLLPRVVMLAVEVNYRDFFEEWLSAQGAQDQPPTQTV